MSSVGCSRWRPFTMIRSAFASVWASDGDGSNVCEFVASGMSPRRRIRSPPILRAIELIGATVVATSSLSAPPVSVSCQPRLRPVVSDPCGSPELDGPLQPAATSATTPMETNRARADRRSTRSMDSIRGRNLARVRQADRLSQHVVTSTLGCLGMRSPRAPGSGPPVRRAYHRETVHAIPELEPDAIRAAHLVIDPVFRDAPQHVHDGLSARLGVPVIVKIETTNPIRSFKGRGTWVAVRALAADGSIGADRPV